MLQRGFANRVRAWIDAQGVRPVTTAYEVRGFHVDVVNSRADIMTAEVVARLDRALDLIERYTPHYFRHMRRDFSRILVTRFACRGAFYPGTRVCLVELTFTVNPEFNDAQIASTILHEGMHARLHALGIAFTDETAARHERFCRRGEIEFGNVVPGGDAVLARARPLLDSADEDLAPTIDWAEAERRVREVDQKSAGRPPSS